MGSPADFPPQSPAPQLAVGAPPSPPTHLVVGLRQRAHVRRDAAREGRDQRPLDPVAALQQRHDAAVAAAVGHLDQLVGEPFEVPLCGGGTGTLFCFNCGVLILGGTHVWEAEKWAHDVNVCRGRGAGGGVATRNRACHGAGS